MKLIIDISDKTYEIIRDMMYFYNPQRSGRGETKEIITAIKQGIPLEDITDGIESHKWGNNEGSKEIYNNAIDDVLTYIEEKIKKNKQ